MYVAVRELAKRFESRRVFQGLDFAVGPGELVLVLGPNGSGKSTLLRLIAGLAEPSAGEVVREPESARIGYMGHRPSVYPDLSGWENLRFWSRLYRLPDAEARQRSVLQGTGLAPVMLEPARHYSRGMLQRLSLARILLIEPPLCLLDEPETGLDLESQDLLRREMAKRRDAGATVLWVSHNPDQVRYMADRELMLQQGCGQLSRPAKPEPMRTGAGA
jgi:heme exporter protein A